MSHPKSSLVLSLILIISTISSASQVNTLEWSTSPYILNDTDKITQKSGLEPNVITFSEFPIDTNITDQYSNRGIIFGVDGNIPFISTDGANPTSPVLSGTPRFVGPIEAKFVSPKDSITPITVSAFSLDAGYFDTNQPTTRIEWFDPNNNKLGEQTNSVIGIQHFDVNGGNIARWRIAIITTEPAGFAIDNLKIVFGPNEFFKVDDVENGNCVVPDRDITYLIAYSDTNGLGDTNIFLTDYLPLEINYISSTPEGNYNAVDRTVTWDIGTVPEGGSGTFIINCVVNNLAEPNGMITNICEISGDLFYKIAEENTPVCVWNPTIIYVDHNATGRNNGMSWHDAYLDLQNALNRASWGGGSEIWVAAGTYKPSVPSGSPTFQFIDSVPVYGHFEGNETSIAQRDFNEPNYETILSGIDTIAPFVVTASGHSSDNILDGFTISGAGSSGDGIYIENAYLKVSNCIISGAAVAGYGIYDTNSAFNVTDCVIQNSSIGIYANFLNNGNLPDTRIENSIIRENQTGIVLYRVNPASPVEITNCMIHNNNWGILLSLSSSGVIVKGCNVFDNTQYGINVNQSSTYILDNWIYHNNQMGIYLNSPTSPTTIRNNTIALNNYGIYRNGGTAPVIKNSIIWSNPSGDIPGCTATYSWLSGNGDPCFIDKDINDFHLRPDSNCIDAGDPCFMDFNEVDIDGECRVLFGKSAIRVDIGADELDWPKADLDRDEFINFIDYALWAPAWQTIDPNKSLDTDSDVDIYDLAEFCEDWLWVAPWSQLYQMLQEQSENLSMTMETQGAAEPVILIDQKAETFDVEEPASITIAPEPEPGPTEEQIKELVEWIDQLWLLGELEGSEEDYLEFRQKIQEVPE